jgi:DNA polymerase-3 subunit epsilon
MSDNGTFEMHMVVELFGHQRIAGKVTEAEIGGAGFIRVDVPKTTKREGFTKFYGPKAIYGMTPVSEAVAAVMAERFQAEPVSEFEISLELQKLLPAAVSERDDEDDWFFEPDDEPFDIPFGSEVPDDEMPDELVIEADNSLSETNPVEDVANIPDPAISEVATEQVMSELITEDMEGPQEDDIDPDEQAKREAAQWARDLLEHDFVILDSETTGLNKGRADEPVQIAVISKDGEVLLDTLVKATIPSELGAYRVHGIGEEQLKDAPTFAEVRQKLEEAIKGKDLIIYNANYDSAILDNASRADDPEATFPSTWPSLTMCAMTWYAKFYGEEDYRGGYHWQKLTNAVKQCGAKIADAHTALGDCLMTLEVIKKMAEYNPA